MDGDLLLELARTACPSWDVDLVVSKSSKHNVQLGRETAASGVDAVLACGGDGTLNAVLNGVRQSGADVILGTIPAGTANVWGREARIPRSDPAGALALLEGGRIVSADVGVAGLRGKDYRFLLMCSVGLDAAVVADVEEHDRLKDLLAQGAFAILGTRVLARFQPVRVRVQTDADPEDTQRSLLMGVAGNTRLYGGVVEVTGDARADDGLLDLAWFEARAGWAGVADRARELVRLASKGDRALASKRAGRVLITPERALPVQADGEYLGVCGPEAPLQLSVEPGAIHLLIAPGASPLFKDEA